MREMPRSMHQRTRRSIDAGSEEERAGLTIDGSRIDVPLEGFRPYDVTGVSSHPQFRRRGMYQYFRAPRVCVFEINILYKSMRVNSIRYLHIYTLESESFCVTHDSRMLH